MQGQASLWTRQFGTPAGDEARGITVDASGVYVAGFTPGALPGQTPAGDRDAFVRKYDAAGNELWTRQFGTPSFDEAHAMSMGGGGVYAAGFTDGSLPGQVTAGDRDAFLRKYDPSGAELWTRQFGSSTLDQAFAVSADASSVFAGGLTHGSLPGQTPAGGPDAFVRKYDAAGNELWTRQFGTSALDFALGVFVDASGLLVVGTTAGALPGETSAGSRDAFVRKYDTAGTEVWTRQFGTALFDEAWSVSADATGVYVVGFTAGALPGHASSGDRDAFVRKYDAAGTELWTRQFGSPDYDQAFGVSADAYGVYVAGAVLGALPGQIGAGGIDAFLKKYDSGGAEIWTRQFGSPADDLALGIAGGAAGLYAAGLTYGALPGHTSAGDYDAFVAGFSSTDHACPRGLGYWKNQESTWPVTTLTLGGQAYNQAELLALLDTPPRGDASLVLAQQLIAALLNVAAGSDPVAVSIVLADADALLASFGTMLPLGVKTSSLDGAEMVSLADAIDEYNSGADTPDCLLVDA